MLYDAYEVQRSWLAGASQIANISANWLSSTANPMSYHGMSGIVAASLDVFAHAAAPRGKPAFDIFVSEVDGHLLPVHEEVVDRLPFGQLKRFVKEGGPANQPRLLIVAPMSGHFATLLRGTVERLLPGHEIFITDWRDAKMVPMKDGGFDLDDYIDYIVRWLEIVGPGAHMLAVCQPSVPAFAATAIMNADDHSATPKSLTMMGGPIDTREAPTAVNTLATERPHAWFQQNVVCTVPNMYPGGGRKVYPGFLQLAGFMTMNLGSHLVSHWEMFKHLVEGDEESAEATRAFYDEYRSVCDMTAEFYLQTVDVVFQRHLLPKGEMMHRGRVVDPKAITRTALLAVEGERDDISGVGQTRAALKLAEKLPASAKRYHLARGAGHYGIFNGRKWREKIAPVVEKFIADHD